jgi:hypothetical protein
VLLWTAARCLPAAPAAEWLDVPTGDGPIGADWPARWCAAVGAPLHADPNGGLLPDLAPLPGADALDVAVRDFYLHTARFSLRLRARWTPGAAAVRWLWARLYARRWRQFDLPRHSDEPLSNEILVSGAPDACQWWVRRYPDERVLYVSRYEWVPVDGAPHVRITFPVPGGAWVVLFRPEIRGSGLVLTESGGRPGGPGLYLVPRGGVPRYVALLREEIAVTSADGGAFATHQFRLLGWTFLTLAYDLELSAATGTA